MPWLVSLVDAKGPKLVLPIHSTPRLSLVPQRKRFHLWFGFFHSTVHEGARKQLLITKLKESARMAFEVNSHITTIGMNRGRWSS